MENLILSMTKNEFKELIKTCLKEGLGEVSSPANHADDELIRIEEAMKILKVSKVTIYNWRKEGRLPYHRVAKSVYFKKSDILEMIENAKKRRRFPKK